MIPRKVRMDTLFRLNSLQVHNRIYRLQKYNTYTRFGSKVTDFNRDERFITPERMGKAR